MLRYVLRAGMAMTVILGVSVLAVAQYPPGGGGGSPGSPGYTPHGSYSSKGPAIAGAAGGAAAVGGLLYWRHHYRAKLEGCLTGDGDKLVSDNDKQTYSLTNKQSEPLKPGERVELRGTKSKNEAGEPTFEVRKMAKDVGSCTATSALK
jgi:hypothetical protein